MKSLHTVGIFDSWPVRLRKLYVNPLAKRAINSWHENCMNLAYMVEEQRKYRLKDPHKKAYGEFAGRTSVAIFVASIAGPLFSGRQISAFAVMLGFVISFFFLIMSANLVEFEQEK